VLTGALGHSNPERMPGGCTEAPVGRTGFCIQPFCNQIILQPGEIRNGKDKVYPPARPILVRRLEEVESVRGGIIIPDSAKEKPQQGEVIAVGKGKSNDEGKVFPLDVKAGDTILFGKYSGTEIKLDGDEFLIMREEEVLGIVKK